MIMLDEAVHESLRQQLRRWRLSISEIGLDVASKGVKDESIIPFLQMLRRPTFITYDRQFYRRVLCHTAYCLVVIPPEEENEALLVRRLLRHPAFNTQRKRMGAVLHISPAGITCWRLHAEREEKLGWQD